jgi:hypothetical protein
MVLRSGDSVATHFAHTSRGVIDNRVSGYRSFAGVGCAEKWIFFLGTFFYGWNT